MNIDRDKINIAITIATLFVSALAFWVSYKSYELSNLKPLFEIGICSHDEYQMNQKYRIIKNNETSYIDLYGQKGGGEFSSHKDLKNDYIIDITRPPSEIHFYIKNIGKVSAENTKIIFDFNGMSLSPDYKEGNVDKGPLEESHFVWEYRPLYPIMEKSYCEMHWVDKDIMYPDIKSPNFKQTIKPRYSNVFGVFQCFEEFSKVECVRLKSSTFISTSNTLVTR